MYTKRPSSIVHLTECSLEEHKAVRCRSVMWLVMALKDLNGCWACLQRFVTCYPCHPQERSHLKVRWQERLMLSATSKMSRYPAGTTTIAAHVALYAPCSQLVPLHARLNVPLSEMEVACCEHKVYTLQVEYIRSPVLMTGSHTLDACCTQ